MTFAEMLGDEVHTHSGRRPLCRAWEGENSVTEGMSWDMLVPRDRPVV
eukprot:gene48547-36388_t